MRAAELQVEIVRPASAWSRLHPRLTPGEVEALMEAAKANRYGHRDATMILLAFRHGLRAADYALANKGP
jgi:integrase